MMTPEAHINAPVRVSIFERLVPSLAFAVAAISGAVGALLIFRMLNAFKQAETAGYAAFFGAVFEIEMVVGTILVVAALLCAIGILVSIVRLFTTNTTSSPPGILFLLVGLVSVVPPFTIHYLLHKMKGIVMPGQGGISSIADTIDYISYFTIGSAVLIVFVLLAFSFIPFSSRAGRKALPLVALIIVEMLIAVLAGLYFWEARNSIAERDKDRSYISDEYYPSPSDLPDGVNSNTTIDEFDTDDNFAADSNATSSSGGKTISGGVLNGKAIDLPDPVYPPAARAVRASGQVSVHVTVDTKGEVVAASAVSGHPLLRMAAVQAARKAKFKPTLLSGQPVKVTGVITYNFSLQ